MATHRPLQNLLSTTGSSPATRSSSSLVTPQLGALADPRLYTADPRLLNWLIAETINTLRESEVAAANRQDRDLYAAQRHVESLRLSPSSGATDSSARPHTHESSPVQRTEPDEAAVRARLDLIGYRVGWATAERLARDRPRFPLATAATPAPTASTTAPPQSTAAAPPPPPPPQQLDILELVKFICKDVWISLFDKQVDNLRTNHRGVYVVSDNALASLNGLSPVSVSVSVSGPTLALAPGAGTLAAGGGGRHQVVDPGAAEEEEERKQLHNHVEAVLAFPSGIIRGALAQLGVPSLVSGTADLSTLPQASFQIKTGAAAFPPPAPPAPRPTLNAATAPTSGAARPAIPSATATGTAVGGGGGGGGAAVVASTGPPAPASAGSSTPRGGTPVVPPPPSSSGSLPRAAPTTKTLNPR